MTPPPRCRRCVDVLLWGLGAVVRYRERNRNDGEEPTRLRFAHTSPIYVTVGGRAARVEASVAEGRALLDAFEKFARETAAPEFRTEILEAVATARTKL